MLHALKKLGKITIKPESKIKKIAELYLNDSQLKFITGYSEGKYNPKKFDFDIHGELTPEQQDYLKIRDKLVHYFENAIFSDELESEKSIVSSVLSFYDVILVSRRIRDMILNSVKVDESVYNPVELKLDGTFKSDEYQFFEHQQKIINRFYNTRKKPSHHLALFMEPRTGKTLPAMTIIVNELLNCRRNNALVICPKSTIYAVWYNQFRKFFNLEDKITVVPIPEDLKLQDRIKFMIYCRQHGEKNVLITNYETFGRLSDAYVKEIKDKLYFDVVVLDESHKIKDNKTNAHRNILRLFKDVDIKLILTGTPYGNDYKDVYNQLKFLEDYPFGCRNKYEFVGCYGYENERGKMELHRSRATDFYRDLSGYAEVITQEDIGMKLPQIDNLSVPMSKRHREFYKRFVDSYLNEFSINENQKVSVTNILSFIAKALQISNGIMYDEDGNGVPLYKEFEIAKMDLTMELIDEYTTTSPVIVTALFKEQYKLWEHMLQGKKSFAFLTGDMNDSERMDVYERFNKGDIDVLICNPKVASLGLDLSYANFLLYPSYNWSLIECRQMKDRILNPNKLVQGSITYIHHEDSIDIEVMKRLRGKETKLEAMLQNTNLYELIQRLAYGEFIQ